MAEVITAESLRKQLVELGNARESHQAAIDLLEGRIGVLLADVPGTPYISLAEAADLLRVSRPTIYRWLKREPQ